MASVGRCSNSYLLYPNLLTPSDFEVVKSTIQLIEQEREDPSFVQLPCLHITDNEVTKALLRHDPFYRDLRHTCGTCKRKVTAIFHSDDSDVRVITRDALEQLTIIHNRYLRNISVFVSLKSLEGIAKEFLNSSLLSCGHTPPEEVNPTKRVNKKEDNELYLCKKHKKGVQRPIYLLPNMTLRRIGKSLLKVVECARRQVEEIRVFHLIENPKKTWTPISSAMQKVRDDSPVWKCYIRFICTLGHHVMGKSFPPLLKNPTLAPICARVFLEAIEDRNTCNFSMLRFGYCLNLHTILPDEFTDKTKVLARKIEEGDIKDAAGAVEKHPYVLTFFSTSSRLSSDLYLKLVALFTIKRWSLPNDILVEIWDSIFQKCRSAEFKKLSNFLSCHCTYLPIAALSNEKFFEFVAILLEQSNVAEIHSPQLVGMTGLVVKKFEGKPEATRITQKLIEFYLKGHSSAWLISAQTELKNLLMRLLRDSPCERQEISLLIQKCIRTSRSLRCFLPKDNLLLIEHLVLYPTNNREENFICTVFLMQNETILSFDLLMKFLRNHSEFSNRQEYRDTILRLKSALENIINSEKKAIFEERVREYFQLAYLISKGNKKSIKKLFDFIHKNQSNKFKAVQQLIIELLKNSDKYALPS